MLPDATQEPTLMNLLKAGLLLVGPFLFGCLLVVLGLSAYLWLAQPKRLAARYLPETKSFALLDPQPPQVSLTDTNVKMIDPPVIAYLNGTATNAAMWTNGKPFKSGRQAAWELFSSAWPLYCLSLATWICWILVNRQDRRRGSESESERSG